MKLVRLGQHERRRGMTNLSAQRVGRQLIAIEKDLDSMLGKIASLSASMIGANTELELDAFLGQRAMTKTSDAYRKLLDARMDLIRTHAELRKISEVHGAIWEGDCPPPSGLVDEELAA